MLAILIWFAIRFASFSRTMQKKKTILANSKPSQVARFEAPLTGPF